MNDQDQLVIIPDPVNDRYAAFGLISWWQQSRVRAATVMVVGAGALGNEVIKGLTLMGVGRLFIVDLDTIEKGNLSRSILFREADSGQPKALVAARAVRSLNPDVAVQAFCGDVNYDLGLGVFRQMDVIVGCLDNREARLSLNRACWQIGKPWVDAGIEALLGQVRVFWPGRGACYECALTNRDYELINLRRSCSLLARENLLQGKVPTTPTAAAIIGGIQTQQVLKILHGLDAQAGISIVFDGMTNDFYSTRLPVKEDCLSHGTLEEIIEMPDARAETWTVAEVWAVAEKRLGSDARLGLGHDLVTGLKCRRCNTSEPLQLPLYRLTETAAQCPQCHEPRMPEIVSEFTRGNLIANQPLRALGVPPLAILVAYSGDTAVGLELTGDAATFFDFR